MDARDTEEGCSLHQALGTEEFSAKSARLVLGRDTDRKCVLTSVMAIARHSWMLIDILTRYGRTGYYSVSVCLLQGQHFPTSPPDEFSTKLARLVPGRDTDRKCRLF